MDGISEGSFYLTLLSSASKDYYPENKTSSFTNQLPHPILLKYGGWKVALDSIIFPKSWYNIREGSNNGMYLDIGDGKYSYLKIPEGEYESGLEIVQELNKLVESFPPGVNKNIKFNTDKRSNKIKKPIYVS